MIENTLILMVGLPRSGKSSVARNLGYPIVSPDAIRLSLHGQRYVQAFEPMVWGATHWFVNSLFAAGHTRVILDACNTTKERRKEWDDPAWRTRYHFVDTPMQICTERAIQTGRQDLIPVIEKMALNFEAPESDESPFIPILQPGIATDRDIIKSPIGLLQLYRCPRCRYMIGESDIRWLRQPTSASDAGEVDMCRWCYEQKRLVKV